jgi:hypothetical protein
MANTKGKTKEERKKARRASRKKAAPKGKRTAARGSMKRKVKKMVAARPSGKFGCGPSAHLRRSGRPDPSARDDVPKYQEQLPA